MILDILQHFGRRIAAQQHRDGVQTAGLHGLHTLSQQGLAMRLFFLLQSRQVDGRRRRRVKSLRGRHPGAQGHIRRDGGRHDVHHVHLGILRQRQAARPVGARFERRIVDFVRLIQQISHRLPAVPRAIYQHQDVAQPVIRRPHHHHRAAGIFHHLLGHTAQQDAQRGAQPPGAHQGQIGAALGGKLVDRGCRVAGLQLDRRMHPQTLQSGLDVLLGGGQQLVRTDMLGRQHRKQADRQGRDIFARLALRLPGKIDQHIDRRLGMFRTIEGQHKAQLALPSGRGLALIISF